MLLPNKVAIVTGGSRGMGRAIAIRFAEEGCSSVIADLREDEAKKTIQEVKKRGKEAVFISCDVSNVKQVKDMVAKSIAQFKKIDILVNCAGVGMKPTLSDDITEEMWDKVIGINMKGVFFCSQAVAAHMKQNRSGNIVNVVSLAAIVPGPMNIHYAVSKAGALTVSNNMAYELARYNIRVNAVLPGMIRTDMTADFAPVPLKDLDQFMGKMTENMPIKREGTVEDIASAALFFASDMSSYITADRLCVGGGMPGHALPAK